MLLEFPEMRISPWTKVWLLGFWLGGLAGFVRADTVIVIELMDSEQLAKAKTYRGQS